MSDLQKHLEGLSLGIGNLYKTIGDLHLQIVTLQVYIQDLEGLLGSEKEEVDD